MGGLRSSAYVTEVITEAPPPGDRQRATAGGLRHRQLPVPRQRWLRLAGLPAASKLVLSVGAREDSRAAISSAMHAMDRLTRSGESSASASRISASATGKSGADTGLITIVEMDVHDPAAHRRAIDPAIGEHCEKPIFLAPGVAPLKSTSLMQKSARNSLLPTKSSTSGGGGEYEAG
jgi:hypothetical protein